MSIELKVLGSKKTKDENATEIDNVFKTLQIETQEKREVFQLKSKNKLNFKFINIYSNTTGGPLNDA